MKLTNCPICGHSPVITCTSLDRGNGRGYPGNFEYRIRCSNAQCPLARNVPVFCTDDIYRSREEAYAYLCEVWNEEAVKINELILSRESE